MFHDIGSVTPASTPQPPLTMPPPPATTPSPSETTTGNNTAKI